MNRITLVGLALVGCGQSSPSAVDFSRQEKASGGAEMEEYDAEPSAAPAPVAPTSRSRAAAAEMPANLAVLGGAMAKDEAEKRRPGAPEAPADDAGGERVREWFPEAFLWQPLVETGPTGETTVNVRVPDQLTTWRVLGLAHSANGQQTGALTQFDSRLDLWVDPVVPGWLYAGDQLLLPVQVASTRAEPWRGEVRVATEGALTGAGTAPVSLAAQGSQVVWLPLNAKGAGRSAVTATLPGVDAAERVIPVQPTGRPERATRGGTLAAPRAFTLASPARVDPNTQRLDVLVFPGPLSLVQAEIGRIGGGSPDGAYGFALAAASRALAERTGTELDEKATRRLQILAWQLAARDLRANNPLIAAGMLHGLRGQSGHLLADEARPEFVRQVRDAQRADGSWLLGGSGSLQAMIVQTAFSARALGPSEAGATLRAAGLIERHARDIDDPYTAAVVLASGLADGEARVKLMKLVEDALHTGTDGARTVSVPSGAVSPWGGSPTRAELLAWTILAFPDAAWRGDLVSELVSGWDARRGFGARQADVIALEAVLAGLPPLADSVEVVLSLDGVDVGRARLDPKQPRVPAVLSGLPAGKSPTIGLRAEPAVPGLGWVATQSSWSAWTGAEGIAGVEVEVAAKGLRVGQDGVVSLTVSAPSGAVVSLVQGLPAGMVVDEDALRGSDGVAWASVRTDTVEIRTRPAGPGEVFEIPLRVRPAFAGRFSTSALELTVGGPTGGQLAVIAPLIWEVSGG